jgi:plastocyanin
MKTLPSVLAAALLAAAATAWTSTPPAYDHLVRIDKNFSPDNLEVMVGDKVVWKNFDSDNHTVTAQFFPAVPQEENYFDSGIIPSGGSFEWQFVKEGSCRYWCSVHREMKGSITIRR